MSGAPVLAVRTTCTESVGFGHLRRCLTLATEAARDARPVLVLTADARGLELATTSGFAVEVLPDHAAEPAATLAACARLGAAAVVADDYSLGTDALAALQHVTGRVLVLDDGDRPQLDVDAVLDANPAAPSRRYQMPAQALQLLGPAYALLRDEFRGLPPRERAPVRRLLITLGGSNPGSRTGPIVEQLLAAFPTVTLDVVAGPLFQGTLPVDGRVVVHRGPRKMVDLMLRADLAVTAGGQTTYELAACGVPAVALCLAENQRANLTALASAGTLRVASDDTLIETLRTLAADDNARQQLANAGQDLLDGRGAVRAWQALAARWFGAAA